MKHILDSNHKLIRKTHYSTKKIIFLVIGYEIGAILIGSLLTMVSAEIGAVVFGLLNVLMIVWLVALSINFVIELTKFAKYKNIEFEHKNPELFKQRIGHHNTVTAKPVQTTIVNNNPVVVKNEVPIEEVTFSSLNQ